MCRTLSIADLYSDQQLMIVLNVGRTINLSIKFHKRMPNARIEGASENCSTVNIRNCASDIFFIRVCPMKAECILDNM